MNSSTIIILIGFAIPIFFIIKISFPKRNKFNNEYYESLANTLTVENLRLKTQNYNLMQTVTSLQNKKTQLLEAKTKQLLLLAVKNSNENEARTAAIKACQKIYKELDIK